RMCGRFTLRSRLNVVVRELDLFGDVEWEPRYNIAPTQPVPIVRPDEDGRRACALARWGLIPSWAKDPKQCGLLINARAETVAEKPAFRTAFRKRRCLVLSDGYYEWQALGDKKKQPYFIHRPDNGVFGFAGLWECWSGGDGPPVESCTITTTTANDGVVHVHDRMPVILEPGEWDSWLAPTAEPSVLSMLLRPFPASGLAADAVGTLVNNAKNDAAECVCPVAVE
ncbi:MAG TPA: SOS response-associated peptidase, partial [Gemmataceae bacterium]|nr:SOS response-associated peptidase [Gemmataceae bacterium]